MSDDREFFKGRGEVVLLVEDQDYLRLAIGEILNFLEYRVLVASNGDEAFQVVQEQNDIALIVSDVLMPKMGGIELAKSIRQLDNNTPIIFASGYVSDQVLFAEGGISHSAVLRKPFTIEKLSQLMRTFLDVDRRRFQGERLRHEA